MFLNHISTIAVLRTALDNRVNGTVPLFSPLKEAEFPCLESQLNPEFNLLMLIKTKKKYYTSILY